MATVGHGRIGIIGMGWVGTSVAISVLHSGTAGELLLNDIRPELAEGEAMDLAHGAAFYPNARVRAATISEMCEADVVVVAAGKAGGPDQTRLELLHDNAAIARQIGENLKNCRGVVIVVSNPVDVLTQVIAETSGLPLERVIGTGTMLETARLRHALGRELDVDPRSIHAQVIGEHGDSSVILWSSARIGGAQLRDWPSWSPEHEERIGTEVRRAAYEIIRRKGATNHAIGLVTAALLQWIVRGNRRVLTVSRVQQGALGIRDLALSLPAIVDQSGATRVLVPEIDLDEQRALDRSADILREATNSIGETG